MLSTSRLKKLLHLVLAIILICIGVVGLVLPILNGVVFLLLGFILLSFESPFIEEKLGKIAKKNKHLDEGYRKLDAWMRRLFRR